MLKNYLKTTYRHLLNNKLYTLTNLLGLTLGLAACLFIIQYVHFELSYDRFHKHAADIYRVPFDWNATDEKGEKTEVYASNVPAFGAAVQAEIPEVVTATRLFHVLTTASASVLSYEQVDGQRISFHEENGFYADSTFFDLFSFPLRYGNPETALTAPRSLVLTTTMAEKYFGSNWERNVPLGKTIEFNGMQQGQFTITGIMEEVPAHSHIQLDFLLSYTSFRSDAGANTSWVWSQCYTYVQLAPQANPAVVENKLVTLIEKHYDWGTKPIMFLQPITSIHLDSDLLFEAGVNGSRTSVYFLSVVGIFILIIGWINYLNLTLAKSAGRAKEVGVRKVIGARHRHIVGQFVIESVVINTVSAMLAIVLVMVLQPWVATYLDWPVPVRGLGELLSAPVYGIPYPFIVLFLAGSITSALYPAWVMMQAPAIPKQKNTLPRQRTIFRKALVISQFTASAVLIFGSLIVNRQLAYMQQYDLGMTIDQVLVLKAAPRQDSAYRAGLRYFKNEVNALATVEETTATNFIPGQEISHNRGMDRTDGGTKRGSNFYIVRADEDFMATLQLELMAGRNFTPNFEVGQAEGVILNEAAVDMLGYDSPEEALHQQVQLMERGDPVLEIVGIIENYHQQSLRQAPESIVLRYAPSAVGYVALRIKPAGTIHHTLEQIRETWGQAFPGSPFDYFFLDDFFNRQYRADRQFDRVFSVFTMLAILIASLGLFGLASYTAVRRTKEVGIRKVLGASVGSILVLLSKEYIQLALVAFVIAMPVANYLFTEWLTHFAYRIGINGWMFAVSGATVLLIALLSVSAQTLKAARSNPVDSLRDE